MYLYPRKVPRDYLAPKLPLERNFRSTPALRARGVFCREPKSETMCSGGLRRPFLVPTFLRAAIRLPRVPQKSERPGGQSQLRGEINLRVPGPDAEQVHQ